MGSPVVHWELMSKDPALFEAAFRARNLQAQDREIVPAVPGSAPASDEV